MSPTDVKPAASTSAASPGCGASPLPLPAGVKAKPNTPELLRKDLKMLALFVRIFCDGQHPEASRTLVSIKGFDIPAISGRDVALCPDCTRLLAHAFVKRRACPYDPKPMCKHCPTHCYHPTYREKIREVMRYSGKKLVLSGRVDYLLHLLF